MYELPLIYVFEGCGFGVGWSIFCIGVLGNGIWSLAFCPEIFANHFQTKYFNERIRISKLSFAKVFLFMRLE